MPPPHVDRRKASKGRWDPCRECSAVCLIDRCLSEQVEVKVAAYTTTAMLPAIL